MIEESEMCNTGERYDEIPGSVFSGSNTVLDVGNTGGVNALLSKHAAEFQRMNYVGIDVLPPAECPLPTIEGDFLFWITEEMFDVVLALHVIEHVPLRSWDEWIAKLWRLTGKYLVIGTPYKEPKSAAVLYSEFPLPHRHKTFGIDKGLFGRYLPEPVFFEVSLVKENWREDGASLAWAILRKVKRVITRHPYARPYYRSVAVWNKKGVEEK